MGSGGLGRHAAAMKIVLQSYPAIGGPTDGRMLTTPWSRVWVHLERGKLEGLAWCESLLDDWHEDDAVPRPSTPLQQSTLYLCPDSDVGYVLLDLVGNSGITLAGAIGDLEGVYVYHHETLSMRWVQLRSAIPAAPMSPAIRYFLLAEFAFREHALAEKAWSHIGQPDDSLAFRVLLAHPDDPDLAIRANDFDRKRRSHWARPRLPPYDDGFPES